MEQQKSNAGIGRPPSSRAKVCFVVFTLFNAILLKIHPTSVPKQDLVACALGFALIVVLFTTVKRDEQPPQPHDMRQHMYKVFKILSIFEVIGTIILPWALILYEEVSSGGRVLQEKETSAHIMAAHLFVFQTQIVLESLIELGGKNQKWILFPLTVIANTYRIVPLVMWVSRSMDAFKLFAIQDGSITSRCIPMLHEYLPIFAIALWFFSSFVFIPFFWYPVLHQAYLNSEKKKMLGE